MLIQTIALFDIIEGSESSLTENVDCNLHFINLLQRYGIDYLALILKTILETFLISLNRRGLYGNKGKYSNITAIQIL